MKPTLLYRSFTVTPTLALACLLTLTQAQAQEKLSRDETLAYARAVSANPTQLNGTPIATEVDIHQAVALRDGDYGGMILPQKNLAPDALAQIGETPVPIGQLWLYQLAPMRHGQAVSRSSLRLVTVRSGDQTATVPQCALALRRSTQGTLELLVYGKDKEPLLTVPVHPTDRPQLSPPIDMSARREPDAGYLTLNILGRYQATLPLTELDPY